MAVSLVRFEDGSRTHWHTHPGEQLLYILDGQGRVGTEEEELSVGPGDRGPCRAEGAPLARRGPRAVDDAPQRDQRRPAGVVRGAGVTRTNPLGQPERSLGW